MAQPSSAQRDDLCRLLVDGSPDMQSLVDAGGDFVFVSPACLVDFGWEPDQVEGWPVSAFAHADDQAQLQADVTAAVAGSEVCTAYRFRCADGDYRWAEGRWRSLDAAEGLLVLSLRDIADRKAVELALHRELATDPLTGVGNRTLFADRLQHAVDRLARKAGRVGVLMLDVDRFKVVNDALGHAMGDEVLATLAGRLLALMRPDDTLARIGGDEFAVLAEDLASAEDALALGQRITAASQVPMLIGHEEIVCTVSIGVAVTDDPRRRPEELMQQADLALYRAKDRGRARAELFDEELRTRAVGRLATERMLRGALGEDRLRVVYQPVVRLPDRAVVGAEALVRIVDSSRTELLPAAFLAVAEETGLLPRMDERVLALAAQQADAWRALDGRDFQFVTVNITARHLMDPTLITQAATTDDDVVGIRVELTEQVLMQATTSGMRALDSLRERGVRVGIDDFGTGFSSLAHLRRLPIDFVKIDKSFIDRICTDDADRALTAGLIDLLHAMGLQVVAEGVEQLDQAAVLTEAGCDFAQGFLFGHGEQATSFQDRWLSEG